MSEVRAKVPVERHLDRLIQGQTVAGWLGGGTEGDALTTERTFILPKLP